jgi:hypothetical protein
VNLAAFHFPFFLALAPSRERRGFTESSQSCLFTLVLVEPAAPVKGPVDQNFIPDDPAFAFIARRSRQNPAALGRATS